MYNTAEPLRRIDRSRAVVLDGLRKCGSDIGRMRRASQGTARRLKWQQAWAITNLEPTSMAVMLADERAGRG